MIYANVSPISFLAWYYLIKKAYLYILVILYTNIFEWKSCKESFSALEAYYDMRPYINVIAILQFNKMLSINNGYNEFYDKLFP